MLKYLFLCVFVLVSLAWISGDQRTLIRDSVLDFDVDIFGNKLWTDGSRVYREDKITKKIIWFEDLNLGQISQINSGNALNYLLYYKDAQRLVFLDNQMSMKQSAIDLADLGYPNIDLVSLSYNTGFWIYDPNQLEAFRYDRQLNKTHSTGNIPQQSGLPLRAISMQEFTEYLVFNDSTYGLVFFDRYGAFVKPYPEKNIADFQIIDQDLFYLKSDTLFKSNLKFPLYDTLALKAGPWEKFRINKGSLYLLHHDQKLYQQALKF